MSIQFTCSFCKLAVNKDTGECPRCHREWFKNGEYWQTKPRRVQMLKLPEVGDNMSDIIAPLSTPTTPGEDSR